MRRQSVCLWLLSALAIAPAPLRADSPQQILGLTLGSSAPAPAQALAVFGIVLAPTLIEESALVEAPAPHYVLKLAGNRELSIWFDANSGDRPIYWIELRAWLDPPADPTEIFASIGPTDYRIAGTQGAPLGVLLITIDPAVAQNRALATRRHIDAVVLARPKNPADDDLFIEVSPKLDYRFELLGEAFRGKMTSVYLSFQRVDFQATELLDLTMARTALRHEQ